MATLRDVAAEANVSIATVSRVLNGGGRRNVLPESARAVRAAAQKLGYQPNRAARSLRTRRSEILGMVVPHITNPFFAGVIQAAERALEGTEWDLLISDAQQDPELEHRRLQSLAARQVDGVIVIPCDGERSAKGLAALSGIPIVQVDRRVDHLVSDWIGVHHVFGIDAVIQHLRTAGRERLCFVGARGENIAGAERLQGYQRALAHNEASAGWTLLGEFTLEWGATAGAQLVEDSQLPDAIVCGNDLIALGVLRALREHGVRVPDDTAVTGFDDIDFASLVDPALTTVRQPIEQIGAIAVDLLQQRLRDPGAPFREVRLTPTLVVRGSSGERTHRSRADEEAGHDDER